MASGKAIIIRRRLVRLAWVAARILWFALAAILTRRVTVRKVAGIVPARFRRT